ncbi:MAG: hypothetical protein IJU28_11260 [Clostridia bacterium]|nr:hypothetical protein [Clostridia bacterium]
MKETLKRVALWGFPLLLMILYPLGFYSRIAHYRPHSDAGWPLVLFAVPALVICSVILYRAAKRRLWGRFALYAVTIACCIFFTYWMGRIPFCTECEPIKKSDLGFMLEPYADTFSTWYLDD